MNTKTTTSNNTKSKLTFIALIMSAIILLIFPAKCSAGVKLGINISLYSLIPAILPFMIFSNFVIKSGYSTLIGRLVHPALNKIFKTSENGSYAIILGFLCGYPLGAKITTDLIRTGKITQAEGIYLFKFINNPSPAFVLCYAAGFSFPDTYSKIRAVIAIYLPSLIIGIVSARHNFSDFATSSASSKNDIPFSKIMDDSIFDALITVAKLTGYVIIFSIISILISSMNFIPDIVKTGIPGILEITSGIYQISLSGLPDIIKAFLTVLISVFGGVSVLFQVNSVIQSSGIKISTYLRYKLFSMILSTLIIFVLIAGLS